MNHPIAPVRPITGHNPLLLNDPMTAWRVKSGAIAIFAVTVANDEPVGERRYLFTVEAGGTLFGYPPDVEETDLGLLAVALEPVELMAVSLDFDASEPDLATLKQWVDPWIQKLSTVEGWGKVPTIAQPPETHYISLPADQALRPHDDEVLWVKMQRGTTYWMGDRHFPLVAELGCYPVAPGTYLAADSDVELFARSTAKVKNNIILVKGIAQLHRYFLLAIAHIKQAEQATITQRYYQRQALNQRVTQATLQRLAKVLQVEDDDYLQADEPLMVAAGAVGKALGVTIKPPLQSENRQRVKEPLEAIARASRLRLRRVLLRHRWWQQDSGPILAYTQGDRHPVALLPASRNSYQMLDPIANAQTHPDHLGVRIPVDESVAATLDPIAYVFYRPLPDGKLQAWDLLRFTLQNRRADVMLLLLTGVAATLMGMVVPQATAVLVDTAIPYGKESLILQMGIGLLAAAFGGAAFQFAQAIASMRLETHSDTTLQTAVWDRLLKLRTSFFRQYSVGSLNARVSGIATIRRILSGTALQSIFSGFFALLNLGLLFYYSFKLAILALAVALIVMVFTIITGAILIQRHRPLLALNGELYGLIVQLVNGVPKLRIAGAEKRAFAHWGETYVTQLRLLLSTQQLEDAIDVFNTIIPVLSSVALFWLASTLISTTSAIGLTTGTFLAFNVAYGTFISGAASLSNSVLDVLEVVPQWQRSQPILDAEPEVDENKADPGRLTGALHVDRATFRYRKDGPLILDDVTIRAEPGEFIALVGPSGSGKSTIFRLLLGFEAPQAGTVYFDGQDLAGLDVSAVRRQLGVVLQNGRINAGTIFENISGGALISMEEAWEAAEMSGLADDVRAMPMHLHTVVSEGGSNLSGGQRQRLVIARALALKPRVLLLDEATSALDNRTQAIVSQSLDRLQVTRIVVAHRLSTIRNADRIYVLEAGQVVQSGSFAELSHQTGLFAQLIQRQQA